MYCCKEMVKILKCYLIPKKSYGTLSKGAIFFGQSCRKKTTVLYRFQKFSIGKVLECYYICKSLVDILN